jgi:hypothetical protein
MDSGAIAEERRRQQRNLTARHRRKYLSHKSNLVTLWQPAPNVLVARVKGFFFEAFVAPYVELLDAQVAAAPDMHTFNDWSEMGGYDSASRKIFTAWQGAHKGVQAHLCVKSAIVAMGVGIRVENRAV